MTDAVTTQSFFQAALAFEALVPVDASNSDRNEGINKEMYAVPTIEVNRGTRKQGPSIEFRFF